MIKRIWAVCAAVFIALQTVFCSAAAVAPDLAEELFALNMSERGGDGFYDGLTLGSADWTAFCRGRLYGAENSSEFVGSALRSAEELVNSESFVAPTELQRAALVLSAFGSCPRELINAAAYRNADLDKQGLNAWIWALAAANCSGLEADDTALYTRLQLAGSVAARQLSDGGFALRGESADVDVTASAIIALAPLADNESVREALDKAVSALSELQLKNGGFLSLGNETCESAAQAVIAFTAAGVDDERLDNAVSALLSYRLEDGGFAHEPNGKTNKTAAAQALQAFTALALRERGELLFDAPKNAEREEPAANAAESTESIPDTAAGFTGFHIKLIISAALGGVGIAALIAAAAKRGKSAAVIGGVLAILSGAVWLLNIRTPDEYYAQTTHENGITVSVGAECTAVLPRLGDVDERVNPLSVIPEDGIILPLGEVTLPKGATPFDALVEAARAEKIRVDYTGSFYGVYVRGIGFVYEFGFGSESGWTYRVNGSPPQTSAGAYTLSEGDVVEFVYTCELGKYVE